MTGSERTENDGEDSKMTIRDTTSENRENPAAFIAQAASIGTTDAIHLQESAGQREVVNSTALPTEMLYCEAKDFEALGFALGDVHKDDPLFREATLPRGWSREGSDHAMWSYIIDERGYRRCSIFYKAAFYDRRAHIGIDSNPRTVAQANAWEAVEPNRDELWKTGNSRREGDNYIYAWRGRYGDAAPQGKHAYSDDGRRLEVIVAPDGSVLDRRTFTVEPTRDDKW